MAILVLAEILTAWWAWCTSDVPENLGNSRTAILAICMQFQSCVVGVPILALLGTPLADATSLGRVFVIWIFSVSSVLVVVAPKLYRAILMSPSRYGKLSSGSRSCDWHLPSIVKQKETR